MTIIPGLTQNLQAAMASGSNPDVVQMGYSYLNYACLQAVYSRKEEKARAFADKYTVKNIFTDLGAMAKTPLIDAVYIVSPNSFHAKQAVLFMLQKKHVLCEKPIASNEKELSSGRS